MMIDEIKAIFNKSKLLYDNITDVHLNVIKDICNIIINSIKSGGKIILFGNGGSAADSQHIVCELVGRFKDNRRALPAIALTTNTSNLTAISNDFEFGDVFKRQIDALANEKDVVWGITTSGNSENVIRAVERANEKGIITVGFTGNDGGKLKNICNYCLIAPSKDTPRIQEFHIVAAHIICEIVEKSFT